jgi:hypothetical protein
VETHCSCETWCRSHANAQCGHKLNNQRNFKITYLLQYFLGSKSNSFSSNTTTTPIQQPSSRPFPSSLDDCRLLFPCFMSVNSRLY